MIGKVWKNGGGVDLMASRFVFVLKILKKENVL